MGTYGKHFDWLNTLLLRLHNIDPMFPYKFKSAYGMECMINILTFHAPKFPTSSCMQTMKS